MTTPARSADDVVAELLDPEAHAAARTPEAWAWLRDNAPVHCHRSEEMPPFWSVTRYDDVRAVYRDAATFSSAHGVMLRPLALGDDPGGGRTLALCDPPRHRDMRGLLAGWFTDREARSLDHTLREATRTVLHRAVAYPPYDLAHDLAGVLTNTVICHVMGFPPSDHTDVLTWTTEAYSTGRALATHHQLMGYLVGLMDERTQRPGDDVMSGLLHELVENDLLADEDVLLNCENLIGASENAALSLATGLLALIEHPDQWQLLGAHPEAVPTAVEEILRWASSATHSMRVATCDTVLGDARIRAGERVVLWIPSANRDPRAFPDPNRFDVTRRPNRHLALGAGPHVCIGGTMARLLLRTVLEELLDLDAELVLAGPVARLRSIVVSGPARLPVRITPGAGRRSTG